MADMKRKKFVELAEKRVNKAILNMKLVGNLSNKNNYSTANDMVELCHYAMKNNEFKQIVKCK